MDFKVKGTKLPSVPYGTKYRCTNWTLGCLDLGTSYDNWVSYGVTIFEGVEYVLAEMPDYTKDHILYMISTSDIERLATEQGMIKEELTELPEYWVVQCDHYSSDFEKVINYLNNQYGTNWSGMNHGDYYGFDGNGAHNGTDAWTNLSNFKNDPTVLTIEEFMKLSNQNTVVDFKVKGTKLPVITEGTSFRCVTWSQMDSCNWSVEANNLISFGTTTFNNETYILAEKANYTDDIHYMFLESTLQELAKKENLTNQKSETMVTIKREQLQEIHDIACSTWKEKITDMAKRQPFGDISLTQSGVDEMFKAATNDQLPVLEKIFGKRVTLDMEAILRGIEVRKNHSLSRVSFYLPYDYTWEVVEDDNGVSCLVPTEKE